MRIEVLIPLLGIVMVAPSATWLIVLVILKYKSAKAMPYAIGMILWLVFTGAAVGLNIYTYSQHASWWQGPNGGVMTWLDVIAVIVTLILGAIATWEVLPEFAPNL